MSEATMERVIVVRRAEFHEKVGGRYYSYSTNTRIDAKIAEMLREFIATGKNSEHFLLVDEQGLEVKDNDR